MVGGTLQVRTFFPWYIHTSVSLSMNLLDSIEKIYILRFIVEESEAFGSFLVVDTLL